MIVDIISHHTYNANDLSHKAWPELFGTWKFHDQHHLPIWARSAMCFLHPFSSISKIHHFFLAQHSNGKIHHFYMGKSTVNIYKSSCFLYFLYFLHIFYSKIQWDSPPSLISSSGTQDGPADPGNPVDPVDPVHPVDLVSAKALWRNHCALENSFSDTEW